MMKDGKRMPHGVAPQGGNGSFLVFRAHLLPVLLMTCILYLAAQEKPEIQNDETRFTMGRISFSTGMGSFFSRRFGRGLEPMWSHDWPRAERHLMKIMEEVTRLDVNPEGHIISFQNDECFKYPIAYICEVGAMELSEEEAARMAEYLLRGGFLIVDDFRGDGELLHFRDQMKRVFPDRALEILQGTHPIWKCFFDISDLKIEPPYFEYLTPQYFGMTDDNGRLMMVVDYNNDISEYWEWSDDPLAPIEQSNEAYKYGVNYLMYALTH